MRKMVALGVGLALSVVACNGSPASEDQTSTTASLSGIPASAAVDSMAWTGSVQVRSGEGASASRLTAEMTGAFVAPAEHRLTVEGESVAGEESSELRWEATIVGSRGRVLESGDVRGFTAEDVADEYMTVLGTATGCVIPSRALLADLEAVGAAGYEDRSGRRTARFEVEGAPVAAYAPLFASDFGLAFGASVQTVDVTIAVDTATGLVVEGELSGRGDGLEVDIAFAVTGFDDPSIVVAVADLAVPDGDDLVAYDDPEGRFRAAYPGAWDVDEFEGGASFSPPFTAVEVYASATVSSVPGGTVDGFIDSVLADTASAAEVVERETVESGGLEYERLLVGFPLGERTVHGVLWLTVVDGFGYRFQLVAEEGEFERFTDLAEAMFDRFEPSDS